MKPYIHQSFWSDVDIESQPPEIKLAALWFITNKQTSILGVCETSKRRFSFETGLAEEWFERALEGLNKGFIRAGGSIFIKNFIRYQFGSGESLVKNNFFKAMTNEFFKASDEIKSLIASHYPEFEEPLQRASKGLLKPKDRIGTDRNGKKEDSKDKTALQIRCEKIFGKRESTAWDKSEVTAWKSAKPVVEQTSEEDFQILEKFYALPQKETYARKSLAVLLNNWNGEVQRAKEWFRGNELLPSTGSITEYDPFSTAIADLKREFKDGMMLAKKAHYRIRVHLSKIEDNRFKELESIFTAEQWEWLCELRFSKQ